MNGRSPFWALLLAAVVVAGCKKHTPATGTQDLATSGPQTPAAAPPPSAPGPAPTPASPPVVVPENADVNVTLSQLSLELRKHVVRTRTVPKTFEEFQVSSRLQVPPAPAGKKYAIQNQAVVLVNR